MPPIQSFQKFMLEQTDEPSAEESLQRYAEYKFKYIEVREAKKIPLRRRRK